MLTMRGIRRSLLTGVLAAGVLVPSPAFACWYDCAEAYGLVFRANGTWYELTGCSQTWPDGSSKPHTTCYYVNLHIPS